MGLLVDLDTAVKRHDLARKQLADMRKDMEVLMYENTSLREHCDTLTHQVICCGVAASHSDATLTTRGAYAGKWNSAQAEEVRKLRSRCDELIASLKNCAESAFTEGVAEERTRCVSVVRSKRDSFAGTSLEILARMAELIEDDILRGHEA